MTSTEQPATEQQHGCQAQGTRHTDKLPAGVCILQQLDGWLAVSMHRHGMVTPAAQEP
jgi:hypothetical protein